MVSEFLTPGVVLRIPETVPDEVLLLKPTWPKRDGRPVREAIEYLEYGKGVWWNGETILKPVLDHVIPMCEYLYRNPEGQMAEVLFVFDNSSNHLCIDEDALNVKKMS